MMSVKSRSLLKEQVMNPTPRRRSEKHRKALTWEPSRLKAVAWPRTGADRPAEPAAPGLPDGPPGPWSTGAGGSLRRRRRRRRHNRKPRLLGGREGAAPVSLSACPPADTQEPAARLGAQALSGAPEDGCSLSVSERDGHSPASGHSVHRAGAWRPLLTTAPGTRLYSRNLTGDRLLEDRLSLSEYLTLGHIKNCAFPNL